MARSVANAVAAATRKIVASISATALFFALTTTVLSHDIYTGVFGTRGWACCGGRDCAATIYRESGGRFEFLTRENEWIEISVDHTALCGRFFICEGLQGSPRAGGRPGRMRKAALMTKSFWNATYKL
jgi:hypothetical protein